MTTTNTGHDHPRSREEFDWRAFLRGWSAEWADAADPDVVDGHGLREAREQRWLGFGPADPKALAVWEARAGGALPPSFRAFLEVTDGWRMTGTPVWLLARTEGVSDETGSGGRSLRLTDDSARVDVVLDPLDVAEDGEWAVRVRVAGSRAEPVRYPSFRAYMESVHERFLADADAQADADALDADVDRARRLALAGDPDGALALLAPAVRARHPRALSIQEQLTELLGLPPGGERAAPVGDTAYTVRELLPKRCLTAKRWTSLGSVPNLEGVRRDFPAVDPAVVEPVLHAVFDGTYRHTVEGPFGEVVARAREFARWGCVDEAWATLRDGMREWRPYDDEEQVAPLGLVADGVLGPLLTARRGRELLTSSRTAAVAVTAKPDGLAWLVAEDRRFEFKWWLVLARGVEPADLPRVLGTERGLSPHPVTVARRLETAFHPPAPPLVLKDSPGKLVVPGIPANGLPSAAAVGRAGQDTEGEGWAFALVEMAGRGVMRSPAPAASAVSGGLVLSVGSTLNLDPDVPTLRVTAAEAGRIVWEVTVGPPGITEPEARGEVPPALDPRRHLAARTATRDPAAPARWLCEALAAEFGVSVSRDAVVLGRLHSLEVPRWSSSPFTP
ncbi:SMI1/KNR4 family protein [Streptomyces sp. NPDC088261]|uniref:SMI1/KNR4 family protein n=1 Tax=Streptomyces sp. NPDC088261 TaxID=3365851 RepID=UPI003811D911